MKATSESMSTLLDELEPDPGQPATAIAGNPQMHYAGIDAGNAEVGVWTCTVGSWEEDPQDSPEVAYITKGRLRLTPKGGEPFELVAGDLLYIPTGWEGRWEVLEDLAKVYVVMP